MKNSLKYLGLALMFIMSAIIVASATSLPFFPTLMTVSAVGVGASFLKVEKNVLSFALVGFTRTCGERSGGGNKLYLAKISDVTGFTLDATNKFYTAATMNASAVFTKYDFEQDTINFDYETVIENGSSKVTKKIEFDLGKMSQLSRNAVEEIKLASSCGMVAIFEDNNSQLWVVGYSEKHKLERPLKLESGKSTTGKALTDANNTVITLVAIDTEEPRTYTGTVPV